MKVDVEVTAGANRGSEGRVGESVMKLLGDLEDGGERKCVNDPTKWSETPSVVTWGSGVEWIQGRPMASWLPGVRVV